MTEEVWPKQPWYMIWWRADLPDTTGGNANPHGATWNQVFTGYVPGTSFSWNISGQFAVITPMLIVQGPDENHVRALYAKQRAAYLALTAGKDIT